MSLATTIDPLDLRIVAALQVDPRASWRKIAHVLKEPERTVARRGTTLIEDKVVTVAAVENLQGAIVASFTCNPGASRMACESAAQRPDTSYAYITTGATDVVTELHYNGDPTDILTTQLPAIPGIGHLSTYPVLKYFKTIRGWRSGLLSESESAGMISPYGNDIVEWDRTEDRSELHSGIVAVLKEDGRASIESIARRVGNSERTVARHLDYVLSKPLATIRALVEPDVMGFQVECQLWIRAIPGAIEDIGRQMAALPQVRYCAAIAGDYQLLVDVTVRDQAALYALLTNPRWNDGVTRIRTAMVVQARKRGGRLFSTS